MASSLDSARATIEGMLATASTLSGNAIIWANTPERPPESGVWLQPTVLWGDGFYSTKNGRNRIVGVLHVNLYAPHGSGTGTLMDTADLVRDVFNRKETSGVRFQIPSAPRLVGNEWRWQEDRWIQAVVTVPFSVEEVVT